MVSEFSKFARIPESNPQPDDLNQVIEETLNLYHDNLPSRIQLKTELGGDIPGFLLTENRSNGCSSISLTMPLMRSRKRTSFAIIPSGEITVRSRFLPIWASSRQRSRTMEQGSMRKKVHNFLIPTPPPKIMAPTWFNDCQSDGHRPSGFVRFSSGEGGGAVFTIELPMCVWLLSDKSMSPIQFQRTPDQYPGRKTLEITSEVQRLVSESGLSEGFLHSCGTPPPA